MDDLPYAVALTDQKSTQPPKGTSYWTTTINIQNCSQSSQSQFTFQIQEQSIHSLGTSFGKQLKYSWSKIQWNIEDKTPISRKGGKDS